MKNKVISVVFAMALVILLGSCKTTSKKEAPSPVETESDKTELKPEASNETDLKSDASNATTGSSVTLGTITWMIEQIDPSFWPSQLKYDATMFVSFFVPLSEKINISDVENIWISSPRDFWTLTSENIGSIAEMDTKKKQLVLKRLQCTKDSVPVGDWSIKFKMKNQDAITQNITVTSLNGEKPKKAATEKTNGNTAQSSGITYVVPKSSADNHDSALAIPKIKSVSRDSDSIQIIFSVNDKRVKNGYFWFDVPGEKYYKDSGSMIDASGTPVNGCRKFSTDGKECIYILRKDKDNSAWFNKIIAVHFVASDTNRVQSPWEEQHRTVSARSKVISEK